MHEKSIESTAFVIGSNDHQIGVSRGNNFVEVNVLGPNGLGIDNIKAVWPLYPGAIVLEKSEVLQSIFSTSGDVPLDNGGKIMMSRRFINLALGVAQDNVVPSTKRPETKRFSFEQLQEHLKNKES